MDEFDELNELLNEMETGLNDADKYIGSVEKKAESVITNLENAERVNDLIRKLLDAHYSATVVRDTIQVVFSDTLDNAELLLRKSLEEALDTSKEYGREPFSALLFSVCSMPDIYNIRLRGTGWASSITAEIMFSEGAGDIESWANAVDSVREALGVDKKKPGRNSAYWKNVIYQSGEGEDYLATISLRLEEAGATAPFWQLLDLGSANVEMSSNYGGRAYPVQKPTNFIKNAEDSIFEFFEARLRQAYKEFTSFEEKIRVARETLNGIIKRGNQVLEDLYSSAEESAETLGESRVDPPQAQSYIEEIQPSKLEKVLEELKQNGTIVNYRVTKDGRVELTEPGSKKRVRKSVAMLMKFAQGG